MEIYAYMCICVFAFPTKISISKKIASDHNPPALKGARVLCWISRVNQLPLSMWFPLVRELPGRAVFFHLLPLREACSCPVAMGITKGWQALVLTQAARRGKVSGSSSQRLEAETWVTPALQWPNLPCRSRATEQLLTLSPQVRRNK